jgi:DNA polymerase III subunit epsilon
MLELDAPLIFIDLETTGPHRKVDRIVQIALIKLYPDGREARWDTYVNPTIPIPPEVIEIHGITDDKVKDAPTFQQLGPNLAKGFKGCDFAGYSVDFDLDFLEEEFKRLTPHKIINGRILDALDIIRKYHPRTLEAMYEVYMNKKLEGAHDARVDISATLELYRVLLHVHEEVPRNVCDLNRQFRETPDRGWVDPDGKLYWRHGEACLNFGEHAGTPLREAPRQYLGWMVSKDFPEPTKAIIRAAMRGTFPVREEKLK